jgi:predicted RecA/RadA family phage recombinase
LAQTPSTLISEGAVLDYTPSGEIAAGDVTIVNSMPTLAEQAIAANAEGGISTGGVWRVPKITGAVSLFAAVYWDADADPVSGTAGSGAATTTAADNTFLGFAVASALSGGATVDVLRVLLPPPRPLDVTAVAECRERFGVLFRPGHCGLSGMREHDVSVGASADHLQAEPRAGD